MKNTVSAWSFSAWETYDKCPLQYKLRYVDKIKTPQSEALVRGNQIHNEAARFLQKERDDLPEALEHVRDVAVQIREYAPIVEQRWGFTKDWKPTTFFANNVWLRVINDALVIYEDQTGEIFDWKTGKKWPSGPLQMSLCATATFARYPTLKSITTRLVYVDDDNADTNQIIDEFRADDAPALRSDWEKKSAPMFTDTVFAPRPNDKCRFCDFNKYNGGQCRFS